MSIVRKLDVYHPFVKSLMELGAVTILDSKKNYRTTIMLKDFLTMQDKLGRIPECTDFPAPRI